MNWKMDFYRQLAVLSQLERTSKKGREGRREREKGRKERKRRRKKGREGEREKRKGKEGGITEARIGSQTESNWLH